MPMPVDWYDDDHTIIKVTIQHDSTWDEYYKVIEWIVAQVKNVDHRIDIVFHDDVGMPKGNAIPHLKWGSQKIVELPNAGNTFIAGSQGYSTGLSQRIFTILAKFFMRAAGPADTTRRLVFLSSFDDALEYIRKERAVVE